MLKQIIIYLFLISTAYANEIENKIKLTLSKKIGVEVKKVNKSELGLYEVITNNGIFYTDANASYVINGNLFDIQNQNDIVNVTEESMSKLRLSELDSLKVKYITYKAAKEKHQIYVFTDISCGYCRKFHQEIKDYNAQGITVNYLAFPRSGKNSKVFKDMSDIWCSKDPTLAFDNSIKGKNVDSSSCSYDISDQYNLGRLFGVTGTPSIVLPNGKLQPGYVPAKDLANILNKK